MKIMAKTAFGDRPLKFFALKIFKKGGCMGDTNRGWWPEKICSDCHKKGVMFAHWGPLTGGAVADLCGACWIEREEDYNAGIPVRPVGVRLPLADEILPGVFSVEVEATEGEEKKKITRVYRFAPLTADKYAISVVVGKKLDFAECSIRRLAQGRLLYLDAGTDEYFVPGRVLKIIPE
jgi:hypothetical protein